jgi:pyruvate dehydrogenase E1 component alpha subunit
MEPVATFTIERYTVLDEASAVVGDLPAFARDADSLAAMYRAMVLTRTFDSRAVALQRTGKLGTFASSLGQEAISVGIGSAMADDDVLVPSYREHGAQFMRGMPMQNTLLYWGGDERGSDFPGVARKDFPNAVPIATQIPHAVGAAFAMKLKGEKRAVVGVVGDGGTSKADFYEAMNMAGVWKAPVVLVVNNNQWAISLHRSRQTAAETIAQKAIAFGIPGIQVDGNDVIAVRQCAAEALERARRGDGPTLVEAVCYRLCDHTTADDATRYRTTEEVNAAWKVEPVARLREYLAREGIWNKEREEALQKECADAVAKAVEAYRSTPVPPVDFMFDHLYATLPPSMQPQLETARKYRHG